MKLLYLECNMGAAGDMLMAALMELCPDPEGFLKKMNTLGIKDTSVKAVKTEKYGIRGHRIDVTIRGTAEDMEESCEPSYECLQDTHVGDVHADHGHPHTYGDHAYHDSTHAHDGHIPRDSPHTHDDPALHDGIHNHHIHSSLGDIQSLIHSLDIPEPVREKACEVYALLAEAEAHVHDRPVTDIHFHEVGTLDAVCDIVGCCLAFHMISPDRIVISPVHVGAGTVKCQHGILPVPAPATAHLLRDVPIYGGEVQGELCTPTGAALLKTMADVFGAMPPMKVEAVGYGMGKREFGRLSCVRAFLGEGDSCTLEGTNRFEEEKGEICEIACNLDDCTGEELAFAYEPLFAAGAVDVFAIPVVMKKGRPGHLLTALAHVSETETVAKAMLTHTSTRGVRISHCRRMTLSCRYEKVETEYGSITIKVSDGWGVTKAKPEYDSVAEAAGRHHTSFAEIQKKALYAFYNHIPR